MRNVSEYTPGDVYQEIDDALGLPIEKTVGRFLPRELAREVRKQAVRYIGDSVNPPRDEAAQKDLRGIYPLPPVPEAPVVAPGADMMATLVARYHRLVRYMRDLGIPDPE